MHPMRLPPYPARALVDVERPTFSSFLDLARWTAAAIVFLGHLRNPMFLGYGDLSPSDRASPVQIWYFVSGFHEEAVVVFFVLSGFLVGGLALAKANDGIFSLPGYAIDRVTRLFLAFLPALIFTALLDAIGSTCCSSVGFYDHTHPMIHQKIASAPFASIMTPEIFAMNMAMLQPFFAPSYGSNQPLWTISMEFWFYVAFGAAMVGLTKASRLKRALGLSLAVLAAFVFGSHFALLFGLWLIGVMAALAPRTLERPVIAATLFAIVLAFVRIKSDFFQTSSPMFMTKKYVVACAFLWLLVSMRNASLQVLERVGNFNRFLANFSYSLYLVHFPLMLCILAVLHATGQFPTVAVGYRPTDGEGLLLYATVIILVYGGAWGFSLLTERNTGRLRRYAKHIVGFREQAES